MSSSDSSAPRGEEIIAPIRVRRAPAGDPPSAGRKPRRVGVGAALVLLAALAAGGLWWIGHLSRHPVATPAAAPPAGAPVPLASPPPEAPAAAPAPRSASSPPMDAAASAGPGAPPEAGPSATALRERLASAERRAAAGELSAARSDFQEALRLDPQSPEARDGLEQVKARLRTEEFRRWMAEGFRALDAGDPDQAKARFIKAKALRPEAPEVAEALAQAEGRLRTARIEAVRARALAAEQREEWAAALAAYDEALALEPALRFAQQGRERTAAMVTLERRIAFFATQPARLDSDAQLAKAVDLLQEIQAAPPESPRLRAAAQDLAALVKAAQTPVRVTIESDRLTEISVYRVGRLGRFAARDLSLRPGTYTVVGSRDGYRDERLDLVVRPGAEPVRVSIYCKVKVDDFVKNS